MFARTIWLLIILASAAPRIAHGETPWVRVADGNRGFVLSPADRPFLPWGLNYDHDENGRLLEDYWDKQWPKVEVDFREMKQLGANVVRIHLQLGCFMDAPEKPNQANFAAPWPPGRHGREDRPLSGHHRPRLLPQARRSSLV